MLSFSDKDNSLEGAKALDGKDELRSFRGEFTFPQTSDGSECLYFAGHSLGLMPKVVGEYVERELSSWGKYGVEGHTRTTHPWYSYHENITESFARLVGARPSEVVAMNTLTVNLHLMMVSFYRPTKKRFKILIENNTFPSDKYAVDSQARFHGYDPSEAVVELIPDEGSLTTSPKRVLEQIEKLGSSLALVMLGNCNYLSGQCFDFSAIAERAHSVGALCGFNLAHGAGNLLLNLHDHQVDFAVWCSYKYLNSGPGGLAGAFIHENHLGDKDIPRFEGWWGNNKDNRFKMRPTFDPMVTAEAWQLSNPPILPLASLRSSMDIFDRATMPAIRNKGDTLTSYLEWLLKKRCRDAITIVTPSYNEKSQSRGSMLSVKVKGDPQKLVATLNKRGVVADFREPDILRMAPAPLYNSFSDVYRLVEIIEEAFCG